MSYSFSARAATKAETMNRVAGELDKVVASQPNHSADREPIEAAVGAILDVISADADGQDFAVSASGSITSTNGVIVSASMSVSATLVNR